MPGLRKGGVYKFKLVPNGYEFLGPGNTVAFQIPRNANDAVAKEHDIAYQQLIDKGINPYFTFSKADQAFLNNIQPDDTASYAAALIFETKKVLARVGVISGMSFVYLP